MRTAIMIEAFMGDITPTGPEPKVENRPCADMSITLGDEGMNVSVFCDTSDNLDDALPKFVEMAADLIRHHQKEKANAPHIS